VEDLLQVLQIEGMQPEVIDEEAALDNIVVIILEDRAHALGVEKRM